MIETLKRHKARTGHYPVSDQIYCTRKDWKICKQHGIRISGSRLGRPSKEKQKTAKEEYLDNVDKIRDECFFNLDKNCYGAGLIMTKLPETTLTFITMSVFEGKSDQNSDWILFALFYGFRAQN